MPENFAARLEATAQRFSAKRALAWDGGELTWGELELRAAGFSQALAELGVEAGQRIALSIPNGRDFAVGLLGGLRIGATLTPLNPLLGPEERQKILADLKPSLLVQQILEDAGRHGQAPGAPVSTDAPALILYTSGSTGQPKGAVLSHRALSFAIESWAGPVMALAPDDVVLAALPLSHSYGLCGGLLAPLLAGATVVLLERFSPDAVLDTIGRCRVTVFPGVPTMFHRLLDSPELSGADLSSLRLAVSGAAPCALELAEEWQRRTSVRLLRGYGMTELFRPISCLAREDTEQREAVGRPVPGVEICVVDEAGQPLPVGNVGELWIKTPAAMDGYLNAPEETEVVLSDGWFRTGDLAHVTPEGFVRIVGRKRELILRGGYSVFPGEVEAVLLTHPAVAEAAVIGVPHPELGEEVAAFVALRPASAIRTEELSGELVGYCKARLAGFKYPRQVIILDRLPKSASGKTLKSRLVP